MKEVRVKVAVEAAGNRQRDINVGDEIRQSAQGEGALNAVEIAVGNDGIDIFDAAGGSVPGVMGWSSGRAGSAAMGRATTRDSVSPDR